jgi:hypothetical protein
MREERGERRETDRDRERERERERESKTNKSSCGTKVRKKQAGREEGRLAGSLARRAWRAGSLKNKGSSEEQRVSNQWRQCEDDMNARPAGHGQRPQRQTDRQADRQIHTLTHTHRQTDRHTAHTDTHCFAHASRWAREDQPQGRRTKEQTALRSWTGCAHSDTRA